MNGLSLEGGGVLGAAQAGMLYQSLSSNSNRKPKYPADFYPIVTGTSIGALNGLLIALRYSSEEIFNIWLNIKQSDLLTRNWSILKSYSRKPMVGFIKNLIKKKIGKEDVTFSELYNLTGVDLVCTGAVIQTGKVIIFGKDYLDYDVLTAVMMSTSHPGVFQPVEYTDPQSKKVYQIIDGGTLINSPILPLFKKKCDSVTVLSIGSVDPNFWFKGPVASLERLIGFITLGNELVSLSWAACVFENLKVYHAPCKNIDILDFNKIKFLLEEGILAWIKGPVDPEKLIFQLNENEDNYKSQIKIH